MNMSNIRVSMSAICALLAACAASGPVSATVSAGNLPPVNNGRAVMIMRIANPRLFRGHVQWMAEHIFIPGVIPHLKALEMQIDIPGGIRNSKPMELLLMPTGVGSGALEPVMIFSASNPAFAVSKLNPPAPVNGISMVVLKNGTSGYVALKKHAVLFASHREALRLVLHHPAAAKPALKGRAAAIFAGNDVSIYLNIHRLLEIEGPRINSRISAMSSMLRASPTGETAQQRLGVHMIRAIMKLFAKRYRSIVGGIRVNKEGVTVSALAKVRVHGRGGRLLKSLSRSRLSPPRQMPDLPLAMALRIKMPYSLAAGVIANNMKRLYTPGAASASTPFTAQAVKLWSLMAKNPDGKYLTGRVFVIAPVKMHDPLEAGVQDFNASDPQAICRLVYRESLAQLGQAFKQQGLQGMVGMTVSHETPVTIDGVKFRRLGFRISMGKMPEKLGPFGRGFATGFNAAITAAYGGDTGQIAIGHLGHRVIVAGNLRASQLRAYIQYLKGHGISAPKIAGAAAQSHYLPGAFMAGFFDPAVELGQLTADVSADSGMMQVPNPVQAGRTPVWALSASCLRNKPEIKLFMPTASLRVSSQQLHRILAGAMMLLMQIQHPASGA
jgi:hypothetical protein